MKLTKTTKTLIYGGTFNPPHLGHHKIMAHALKKFDVDRVLVVPSFQKIFDDSGNGISYKQRLELTKLNFQGLHPKLEVSDLEKNIEPPVYSFHLLSKLKATSDPKDQFLFLMGDDQIPTLAKWFEFQGLCEMTDFVIANRQIESLEAIRSNLTESLSGMGLKPTRDGKNIKLTDIHCTFYFLENPVIKISSTAIRKLGYSLQNLHPDVMKAIEENHVDY